MSAQIIPGAICSLLGGLAVVFGTRVLRRAKATERWPSCEGVITASHVDEYRDSDGDQMYRPIVRYEYAIGARPYQGDTIAIGGVFSTSWKGPAERMVASCPEGGRCAVYYDPTAPDQSCLRQGVRWHLYLAPGIGYILSGVGAYFLLQ